VSQIEASANPVLVEVTRGPAVESQHRGAAVVVDAGGGIVAAWGDVETPIFTRSAVKPLQAICLIETGAADRYCLGEMELALSCASHTGQERHIIAVTEWLSSIGLAIGDLECGPQRPIDRDSAAVLLLAGQTPDPAHNNCSGKHAGILTTAMHMSERTHGYCHADHPAQVRIRDAISDMADWDLSAAPCGIDGCSMPTYALPLVALAHAGARFARPTRQSPARADACVRLAMAMRAQPLMVRGYGSFDSHLLLRAPGRFIAKTGAEGVYFVAVPERGLGIALKIDDGTTRASQAALAFLLAHLGLIERAMLPLLLGGMTPIPNTLGDVVGEVRAAASWLP